ncbi:MAG: hypothetical protein HC836_47285 [Richelia sp. RM2_1_2]|nr:hypothetical protein [Richelia sp. RM2_1_2]
MINVIVPMAGRGKRFADVGYQKPKPFIDVLGKPMILKVVDNLFVNGDVSYTFICLSSFFEEYGEEFKSLLVDNGTKFNIVQVDKVTEGAACTVLFAKDIINNDNEMIIANCDQLVLDYNFMNHSINFYREEKADGGILCFLNNHPKWSYVSIDSNLCIMKVVEKQVISNIATVGVYYYRKGKYFVDSAEEMISSNFRVNNEFYVAPAFNNMICRNQKIVPYMINKMVGLGTPEDLEVYKNRAKQ